MLVPRVLEVVKSQLCYIVGTVYLDMPLKPNVLEDIGRDVRSHLPPMATHVLRATHCYLCSMVCGHSTQYLRRRRARSFIHLTMP